MSLFQKIGFSFVLIIGVQAAFALQIEAPSEIEGHVLAYSDEAGAANRNAILRVGVIRNAKCDAFEMKLIDKNSGKTLKEIQRCFTDMPNAVLQNGIFELFGVPTTKTETGISANTKTFLFGIGFVAAGLSLYYSKQPKPVPRNNSIGGMHR